jgi:hypothetical protein
MCFGCSGMLNFLGYSASLQQFQKIAVLYDLVLETREYGFVSTLVLSYHCQTYIPIGKSLQNLLPNFKIKDLDPPTFFPECVVIAIMRCRSYISPVWQTTA